MILVFSRSCAALGGLRLVVGPDGGSRRDLPVSVLSRHGRSSGSAATRQLGQLPTLPTTQRLPENGL